jgi:CheY-like chemotaxis protein
MTPDKTRVVIAGNIYDKLALVRRFLEEDGYEVVGVASKRQDVIYAVQQGRPDAVVIDEELIDEGLVGTLLRIRAAQPRAKVVVFTSGPPIQETAPKGADGYLEKGTGLAVLTSMLDRLLADRPPRVEAITTHAGTSDADTAVTAPVDMVVIPAAEGTAAAGDPDAALEPARFGTVDDVEDETSDEPRFGGFRLAALAAGFVLIVWSLVALLGGNEPHQPSTRAAGPSPSAILAPDELQLAYATLDSMIGALRSGNYVLATVDASELMQGRETAQAAGFSIGALDDEITARLDALVGTLPTRVNTQLQDSLGSLFPQLASEQPPGGSTLLVGDTVTSPVSGGTSSVGGTTGGSSTGGSSTGGSSTGGSSTGGGTTGGESPGGGATLGPGDGRAWGQSHKPPHGGWHGEKPNPHRAPQGGWHGTKPKHHGQP